MATSIKLFAAFLGAILLYNMSGTATAQPGTVPLQPFSAVQVCAPFSVLIKTGNGYSLTIDAEQSVKNAVSTVVRADGTLSLGTTKAFKSTQPIKLTVTAPATALKGVIASSPISSAVTVASGFTPPASGFLAQLTGASNLYLMNLAASSLTLINTGAGTLVAKGTFGKVAVTDSGAGQVYVGGGTIKDVTANVSGVGQLTVDPTNADAQITGSTQLLGKIIYSRGSCNINNNMPGVANPAAAAFGSLFGGIGAANPFGAGGAFGGTCTQYPGVLPPRINNLWTCGISVTGVFDCSSAPLMSASTSISSSSSGGGMAASGTSTPGGFQFVQSSGPGQSVVTGTGSVQTVQCAAPPTINLSMI